MAPFLIDAVFVCWKFIGDYIFLFAIATIILVWKYDPYFANPAGPAARIDGGGGGRGGEGQVREGGEEPMAHVDYRYLGTGALLRQRFQDALDNVPGRARALPRLGRWEGNEEDEADLSAWVVLKGQMVERWRAGLAQLEVPLEWWSREWKGFLLLLGLVVLGSFIFDPDLSASQDELAEITQTIAVAEVPQKSSVVYTYEGARAAADLTATVIATPIGSMAGFGWETSFVGTLEEPLYSREIWSDETWASAWASGMMGAAFDGETSTSRSVPADLCSLLIQRCGTYEEDWESCGLEPIAPSIRTMERCMDLAAGERRHLGEKLLSRSAEPAKPLPMPTLTSTRAIDSITHSLESSAPAPMATRPTDSSTMLPSELLKRRWELLVESWPSSLPPLVPQNP